MYSSIVFWSHQINVKIGWCWKTKLDSVFLCDAFCQGLFITDINWEPPCLSHTEYWQLQLKKIESNFLLFEYRLPMHDGSMFDLGFGYFGKAARCMPIWRLTHETSESPHFMYASQTLAASESVSATTARKMRYSRETETWAKDTVNSRRHDMFSRLFRDYQSDLKKRKLLLLDDDDGKFSSSLYFAEDQWSNWVLTDWHTWATNNTSFESPKHCTFRWKGKGRASYFS